VCVPPKIQDAMCVDTQAHTHTVKKRWTVPAGVGFPRSLYGGGPNRSMATTAEEAIVTSDVSSSPAASEDKLHVFTGKGTPTLCQASH